MSRNSNGLRRALVSGTLENQSNMRRLINGVPASCPAHVCRSCRQTLARRCYASTATAAADPSAPLESMIAPAPPTPRQPAEVAPPRPYLTVHAGVLLSRPPLLTPDPHPFEAAYHLYSRRLNERLVLPFTQHFYYKRGTPAFEHWRAKRRERGGAAARDIGVYNAYGEAAWNDEVRVGETVGGMRDVVTGLLAEEAPEDAAGRPLAGFTRESPDDERSLERRLMRTVYLLVKRRRKEGSREGDGWWGFPSGPVQGTEGVRDTAERVLGECAGADMNTWFVGRHPVGWYGWSRQRPVDAEGKVVPKEEADGKEMVTVAEKTFFIKSRIMAGQANVQGNVRDVVDFKWLCKEEVQNVVTPAYWAGVKNMLVEQ